MLLLLPPSETKRDGGADASALDLTALGFPELTPERRAALSALRTLSRNVGASMTALGLGPTQRAEVDRNRAIASSPVLPAIERYTGVLYDSLDAGSLDSVEQTFAADHIAVHSALFGLLRADDPIPAYRLSHDSRLPGLPLRGLWRGAITRSLSAHGGLILDLRSESYVALGPAPEGATYVRVVSENSSGRRVALSHFNKKAKGEFVRAVIQAGVDHSTSASLAEWAESRGIRIQPGAYGELDLVV